jgi:excisionase family DNA binding protein
MSNEILTVLEVAALFKVADKTVYTMAQKGEIPAFQGARPVAVPAH